jgi:SAM-dependent methyltransferase
MIGSSSFSTSVASLPFEDSASLSVSGHGLHPFPARMAPEIVVKAVGSVPRGSTVLDTMCGSGTVLRESVRHGHRAIGFDVDPLAVLISRVSTRRLDLDLLMQKADNVANRAASLIGDALYLPWIDTDDETRKFTEFWFGYEQREALRALSWLVFRIPGPIGDALRLAISKTIVTKEPRASLARDTSHSRPHRVALTSEYDVIQGFRKAVVDIINKLAENELTGTAEVRRADARHLPFWLTGQAHLVVTSPPYGNAIDYLRGHRLALVWLGYNIPRIRAIKAKNIGRQTGPSRKRCPCVSELTHELNRIGEFQSTTQRRLSLFVQDMYSVLQEIYRSLLPRGRAILVVGNSLIDGQFLDNAKMIAAAGEWVGLREIARYSRNIPGNHRYLPPPRAGCNSALGKRMKEEVILTFEKTQ